MRSIRKRYVAWMMTGVAAALALFDAIACSTSDHAQQCNADPWSCSAGQTCWVQACTCPPNGDCNASNCTAKFACMPSEPDKQAGEDCHLKVGSVTCGDRQACIQFAADGGSCRAYCDPARSDRGCPDGQFCAEIHVGESPSSPTEHVCVPNGFDAGGGNVGVNLDAATGPQPDVNIEGGKPTA
jgi:hypothetical protein